MSAERRSGAFKVWNSESSAVKAFQDLPGVEYARIRSPPSDWLTYCTLDSLRVFQTGEFRVNNFPSASHKETEIGLGFTGIGSWLAWNGLLRKLDIKSLFTPMLDFQIII